MEGATGHIMMLRYKFEYLHIFFIYASVGKVSRAFACWFSLYAELFLLALRIRFSDASIFSADARSHTTIAAVNTPPAISAGFCCSFIAPQQSLLYFYDISLSFSPRTDR